MRSGPKPQTGSVWQAIALVVTTFGVVCGHAAAISVAEPPASDSWRDDTLPREIPVAPFRGTWREFDAPDTEDLADYARRAVNAATRMVNPDCDDAVAQVIHVGEHPSVFEVCDGSLININAKFAEALPLLRTMCGSDFNLDVDGRIIGALVAITGRDGLCYQPVEGRPWAYLDERTRDAGQPYADIFGEGRQLRAYAVWFAHDGNPLWSELAERKAAKMLALAVPVDDGVFFRVGRGFTPTDKDPSRGELVPVADVGNYDAAAGMTGSPAAYIGGWTPGRGELEAADRERGCLHGHRRERGRVVPALEARRPRRAAGPDAAGAEVCVRGAV